MSICYFHVRCSFCSLKTLLANLSYLLVVFFRNLLRTENAKCINSIIRRLWFINIQHAKISKVVEVHFTQQIFHISTRYWILSTVHAFRMGECVCMNNKQHKRNISWMNLSTSAWLRFYFCFKLFWLLYFSAQEVIDFVVL